MKKPVPFYISYILTISPSFPIFPFNNLKNHKVRATTFLFQQVVPDQNPVPK